ELVLLLDRDPGEIATPSLDLLVSLRLLGLELGELVPGHLPFLAGSNPVFRHLSSFQSDSSAPAASRIHRRIGRYRDHELRPAATRKLIAPVSGSVAVRRRGRHGRRRRLPDQDLERKDTRTRDVLSQRSRIGGRLGRYWLTQSDRSPNRGSRRPFLLHARARETK